MSKFKKGDIVRVKADVKVDDTIRNTVFVFDMTEYIEQCLVIDEDLGNGKYKVQGNNWTWCEEWFEDEVVDAMSTIMDKSSTYTPTEEEIKYLKDASLRVLNRFDYSPTENGIDIILNEWLHNKGWLINLFKKHPQYVDGKFYIKIEAELKRPIDKKGIRDFADWVKINADKAIIQREELMIGMFTMYEYKTAMDETQYIANSMVDNSVYNGMTKAEWYKEYLRMENVFCKAKEKIGFEYYYLGSHMVTMSGKYIQVAVERAVNQIERMPDPQYIDEEYANYVNDVLEKTNLKTKCVVGNKTTKFIGKLLRELGMDKIVDIQTESWVDANGEHQTRVKDKGYNYYRALLGDSINPYTYKQPVYISVNPIDYWMMSIGYKWTSCHGINLDNDYGYRGEWSSGTESYMLDDCSLIAYVLPTKEAREVYGEAEYEPEECSKLKRCVFFLAEDKLVQSRVYPDGRDGGDESLAGQLRAVVQKLIADLYETPNFWKSEKGTSACKEVINTARGATHYEDYFHYSDCNVSYLKRIDGMLNKNVIVVGHKPICPCCGDEHTTTENIMCDECREDYYAKCENCGCGIQEYGEYIYTEDDHYYCCEDCAERDGYYCSEDTGNWIYEDNLYKDYYTNEYYEYEGDDAVESYEGHWYRNEYNCEADGNMWCEDIEGYSNEYERTEDGYYVYDMNEAIKTDDGKLYWDEDKAKEAGYEQNEDGNWIAA